MINFMSLEKIDNVWLVLYTKTSIEIVGIYTSLEKAVEVCKDMYYVVGPFTLDKDYTEIVEWAGAFRPMGGDLYPKKRNTIENLQIEN